MNGLPPEAAVWRVDGQQWTTLHELLAMTAERVDAWGLANARIHLSKKHQRLLPEESLRIPRPGEEAKPDRRDRVIDDVREIAAWFAT